MPDPAALEVHFLDVGPTMYGDCIVVRHGAKTILIDGAHQGDMRDRPGFPSIPTQLDELFGGAPRPHRFDLLVVTHCHFDHIGCLPEMVAQGVIACTRAYVADESLGWGEHGADTPPAPADARVAAVLAALREENTTSLAAIASPTADTATVRTRYHAMLAALAAAGSEIIACDGNEDRAAIEADFTELGMRVLGPTTRHLRLCADQIARMQRDATEALNAAAVQDAAGTAAGLYRQVVADQMNQDEIALLDQFGVGSALNDQSIVIALIYGGRKVLLGGDMQFAKAEVNGLDDEMTALRGVVRDAGPYDLIKTSHHTSYNGWDDSVGEEQLPAAGAVWLVHSGGVKDANHPDPGVLRLLKDLRSRRSDPLTYLRTDRNGLISVTIGAGGQVDFTTTRGRVNDLQPNTDAVPLASPLESVSVPGTISSASPAVRAGGAGDFVEVTARIPHVATRVTITVGVEPVAAAAPAPASPTLTVRPESTAPNNTGGGATVNDPAPTNFRLPNRSLPALLFVTDEKALTRKIGADNVRALLGALQARNLKVCNDSLSGLSASEAAARVRPHLDKIEGVVLLGGGDVVPAVRLDVLGPDLRPQVHSAGEEPDNFIVWNDEIYGDRDGDQLGELPVSRIADGGSAALVAAALGAGSADAGTPPERFGVRNVSRPFADAVYRAIPGERAILVSQPARSADIRPVDVRGRFVYLMLHGDDSDARRFWGEIDGNMLEAFSLEQVPPRFMGVVFAGCCWGGLTTTRRALSFPPGTPVVCRTPRDSVALRFLAAGAQAFVGCTGVHYSPSGNRPDSAGGPMHVAFFERLRGGEAPALALFHAKQDCLQRLTPGTSTPEELAISLKVIRQFTCLGLGW